MSEEYLSEQDKVVEEQLGPMLKELHEKAVEHGVGITAAMYFDVGEEGRHGSVKALYADSNKHPGQACVIGTLIEDEELLNSLMPLLTTVIAAKQAGADVEMANVAEFKA